MAHVDEVLVGAASDSLTAIICAFTVESSVETVRTPTSFDKILFSISDERGPNRVVTFVTIDNFKVSLFSNHFGVIEPTREKAFTFFGIEYKRLIQVVTFA